MLHLAQYKTWVVSGRNEGKFSFDENGRAVITVSIFPLQYGKICLPSLGLSYNSKKIPDNIIKISKNNQWIDVIS